MTFEHGSNARCENEDGDDSKDGDDGDNDDGGDNGDTAVAIPDSALRTMIATSLGKSKGDTITRSDLALLTKLDYSERGIADLTGLELKPPIPSPSRSAAASSGVVSAATRYARIAVG